MRRLLLLLTFFIGTQHIALAQKEQLSLMAPYVLEGKWTGHLTQQAGGLARKYYYQIEITLHGNEILAKGFIKETNREGHFAIEGSYSGTIVQLKDLRITQQKLPKKAAWCIKTMKLQLILRDGVFCLKGDWSGYVPWGNCNPGTIFLTKDTIRA